MKKSFKYKSDLLGTEVTFTVNKKLNKVKVQGPAKKKLDKGREDLRNLKTPLPE